MKVTIYLSMVSVTYLPEKIIIVVFVYLSLLQLLLNKLKLGVIGVKLLKGSYQQ